MFSPTLFHLLFFITAPGESQGKCSNRIWPLEKLRSEKVKTHFRNSDRCPARVPALLATCLLPCWTRASLPQRSVPAGSFLGELRGLWYITRLLQNLGSKSSELLHLLGQGHSALCPHCPNMNRTCIKDTPLGHHGEAEWLEQSILLTVCIPLGRVVRPGAFTYSSLPGLAHGWTAGGVCWAPSPLARGASIM